MENMLQIMHYACTGIIMHWQHRHYELYNSEIYIAIIIGWYILLT